MKKRLKITKGKNFTVIPSGNKNPRGDWYYIRINPVNGWGKWVADATNASIIDGTIEEAKANAELIADTFNTANETQLLPSELQEQRDELLKTLQSLVLSMAAHPDCTKGSEFDDLSSLAQELINKID